MRPWKRIRKVWRSMGQPGCLGIFNYQGWCIFESVVCRSCHHIHNCYINHYKPSSCHGNPLYVRRSKLNSCGEVMASLHKAPYHYTQSQHPFHQLGRIAARRRGSRWGIGFLFLLRRYLQGNSDFLRGHQGWRRQLQLDTSRAHCRSSDLGGCPWLVLSWLVLPVLPCLRRLFFFTPPPLQPNTTPKWIGKTLTKWTL